MNTGRERSSLAPSSSLGSNPPHARSGADRSPGDGPIVGICRDSVARLDAALAGISYPAEKWELIAHAEIHPIDRARTDLRTIRLFWALPSGRYADRAQVLAAAARTARGHPHHLDPPAVPRPGGYRRGGN